MNICLLSRSSHNLSSVCTQQTQESKDAALFAPIPNRSSLFLIPLSGIGLTTHANVLTYHVDSTSVVFEVLVNIVRDLDRSVGHNLLLNVGDLLRNRVCRCS